MHRRHAALPVLLALALVPALACASAGQGKKDLPGAFAKSTVQFEFAKGLLARNLFPEAAEEFTKFIKEFHEDPRMPQAVFWRGEALFGADRYGEAALDFRTYITNYGKAEKQDVAGLRYGCCLFELGRHKEGVTTLRSLAERGTDDATGQTATYYLGLCYRALKKYAPALETLERLKTGSFAADALYERAEVKSLQGEHVESAGLFRSFIEKHLRHRRVDSAFLRRGEELRIAGRLDAAAGSFLALLKSAPQDPTTPARARYGLAWVRYAQGNYSAAEGLVSQVAGSDVAGLADDAGYLVGLCALQLKDYARAEMAFKGVTDGRYRQAAAVKYAWALLAAGKNDAALAAVERCLRRFPKARRSELDYVAGKALAEMGDRNGAAERLARARDAKGTYHAEAAYEFARVQAALGNDKQAVSAYSYFLQNFPQHPWAVEAMVQLGQALVNQKRYDEAAAVYGGILTRKGTAGRVREHSLNQQAICYYWTGQYGKMKGTYERLLEEFPKGAAAAEALYWLGWYDYEKKLFAKAASLYGRLIEQFPGHPLAAKARYRRAMSLYQNGQEPGAARDLYEIITKHPQTPIDEKEILWLGRYMMKANRLAEADTVFDVLLAPRRGADREARALALYFQAESRRRREDWAGALERYEQSLAEKNTELEPAGRFGRAVCLRHLGRVKKARKALAEVKLSPDDPLVAHYYAELGHLDYADENYDSAAANLMRVGLLYDEEKLCGEALLTAGLACLKTGDKRRARICFEELAGIAENSFGRRYPGNTYTKRGMEELRKLTDVSPQRSKKSPSVPQGGEK